MVIDYFDSLDRIAREMDRTRVAPDATVGYDVLSDALVWSDEYPRDIAGRLAEFDCVKLLLRYRTTLLLGKPNDSLRPYWDHGRRRFPNWAGFCPERLTATEELRAQYEHDRHWAMRRVERFEKVRCSAGSAPEEAASGAAHRRGCIEVGMRRFALLALAVSAGLVFGAVSFWATYGDKAREFNVLKENALCVLELPAGAPSASASFTTPQTIDQLHVGVRAGKGRQRISLSVSGSEGLMCSATTDATRFSWTRAIPPGTYEVTLRQEAGGHGALVVVAAEKPVYVTGWQIWCRAYLGLLVLSAIGACVGRRSRSAKTRARSLHVFQIVLLGFLALFLYLLFHEGGHALGEIAFGRFDLARSDFWGIHGTPHSGGTSGPPLAPWQQAIISGGGPLLPTFVGWGLFVLWSSRFGRKARNARPVVNLYFSAVVAMLVLPFVATAGCLLGIVRDDGDWNGFVGNVPGPPWLVRAILWGTVVVSAFILWRVAPELWRSGKAQYVRSGEPAAR